MVRLLLLALVAAGCGEANGGAADLSAPPSSPDLSAAPSNDLAADAFSPRALPDAGVAYALTLGSFAAFRNLVAADGRVAALLDGQQTLTAYDAVTGALLATIATQARSDAGGVYGGGTIVYATASGASAWYPGASASTALAAGADLTQLAVSRDGLYLAYPVAAGAASDLYVQPRGGAPTRFAAAQTLAQPMAFTTTTDDLFYLGPPGAGIAGNSIGVLPKDALAPRAIPCIYTAMLSQTNAANCRTFATDAFGAVVIIDGELAEAVAGSSSITGAFHGSNFASFAQPPFFPNTAPGIWWFLDNTTAAVVAHQISGGNTDMTVGCPPGVTPHRILGVLNQFPIVAGSGYDAATGLGDVHFCSNAANYSLEAKGSLAAVSADGLYAITIDASAIDPTTWGVDVFGPGASPGQWKTTAQLGAGTRAPAFASGDQFIYLRGTDLFLRDATSNVERQLASGASYARGEAALKRAWWIQSAGAAGDGLYGVQLP